MKKKSFYLTAVLLMLYSLAGYSQVEKNVCYKIGVGHFSYTPKEEKTGVGNVLGNVANVLLTGKSTRQQPQYADAVRAGVISGLGNVMRFRVVAGEFDSHEQTLLADGIISNISTTSKVEPSKEKGKAGQEYFRALISVTVNLKDAATGEVVSSRVFSITDSDCSWMASAEKSIDYALGKLSDKIKNYFDGIYPLNASVVEAGESKKDKQKTVYIDLGSAYGVCEGMHFDVFSVKTIAGKEARIEIGRLKIDQVLGEELSLCKVSKGEKQIKTALDNGETLVLTSR